MKQTLEQAVETSELFYNRLKAATDELETVMKELLYHPNGFEEFLNSALQLFGKNIPTEQAVNIFWPLLGDCDTFTAEDKMKALELAEILGPDWVSKFRRVGKFMAESMNA